MARELNIGRGASGRDGAEGKGEAIGGIVMSQWRERRVAPMRDLLFVLDARAERRVRFLEQLLGRVVAHLLIGQRRHLVFDVDLIGSDLLACARIDREREADQVNVENEMTSLADEQVRYDATEKLLEKAYASFRSSIKG